MHRATFLTGARFRLSAELLTERRRLLHDVGDGDLDAMDEPLAVHAEPFEPVLHAGVARALDHEANGGGRTPPPDRRGNRPAGSGEPRPIVRCGVMIRSSQPTSGAMTESRTP